MTYCKKCGRELWPPHMRCRNCCGEAEKSLSTPNAQRPTPNASIQNQSAIVVVAWHNAEQRDKFCEAWQIEPDDPRVHFQQDKNREGCARTKNKGVAAALEFGAEIIIVLDDDCLPADIILERGSKEVAHDGATAATKHDVERGCAVTLQSEAVAPRAQSLEDFISAHVAALEPQPVEMFEIVTDPPSRGTPYFNRSITMPVAASLGFWLNVGDYDAPGQLVHGATHPMTFRQKTIHGKYFAFSGMNFAFRRQSAPFVQFVDLPRWDDIFMGYIFQKIAYANGYCFNLGGPLVTHSRQSNVWQNLRDEALHIERNETLWQEIAQSDSLDAGELRRLIPGEVFATD